MKTCYFENHIRKPEHTTTEVLSGSRLSKAMTRNIQERTFQQKSATQTKRG
jgi:hypothetical protein